MFVTDTMKYVEISGRRWNKFEKFVVNYYNKNIGYGQVNICHRNCANHFTKSAIKGIKDTYGDRVIWNSKNIIFKTTFPDIFVVID